MFWMHLYLMIFICDVGRTIFHVSQGLLVIHLVPTLCHSMSFIFMAKLITFEQGCVRSSHFHDMYALPTLTLNGQTKFPMWNMPPCSFHQHCELFVCLNVYVQT